jgi:tRNA(Ile)-lysidine synthase
LLDRLESGRDFRLGLQAGLEARARSGRLALLRIRPERSLPMGFHIEIPGVGTWPLPGGEARIRVQVQTTFRPEQVRANRAYFDLTAAPFPLEIRSPRPGDRFLPWGSERSCKVARLLLNEKVPRPARSSIPLLVRGDQILWVVGHRRSRLAPIPANCRDILRVECLDGGGPRP